MKNHPILLTLLTILFISSSIFSQGQNWKREITSNYFYVKCAHSKKFWDLPGKHPKTAKRDIQFQIWDNDEDKYERTFKFFRIENTDYYAIINLADFIVDVAGKKDLTVAEEIQKKAGKKFKMKKDNGVEIQTWERKASGVPDTEQWRLIIVDKNTVMFENVFTRKAISVKDGAMGIESNGSKLVSWERNGNSGQLFQLMYADGPKKGQFVNFEQ